MMDLNADSIVSKFKSGKTIVSTKFISWWKDQARRSRNRKNQRRSNPIGSSIDMFQSQESTEVNIFEIKRQEFRTHFKKSIKLRK